MSTRSLCILIALFAALLLAAGCDDGAGATPEDASSGGDTSSNTDLGQPDGSETSPDADGDTSEPSDQSDQSDQGDDGSDLTDVAPDTDSEEQCSEGQRACGGACCESGDVCASNQQCCPRAELCGNQCCGAGTVCEGAVCQLDCGAQVRCTDAAGASVCCGEGEICTSGQCYAPSTPCVDFFDCAADQYCETTLGVCLPQPGGEACELVPSGGDVVPTLRWHWDGTDAELPMYNQVMMSPMVARIDDDDVPDVVFISFQGGQYGRDGILRVVSGADGSLVFDVTDPLHRLVPGSQVALGDIDGDGEIEIVACHEDNSIIAFERDGSLAWKSTASEVYCSQAAVAIADLDADGFPEVFVRFTVLDGRDGSLKWHRDCKGTGDWSTDAHTPCDYTTAADLDGDGKLEVVGGNQAFDASGAVFFDRSDDFLDGYPAIGDLDLDGEPDIVIVHSAFYPSPYAGDHWLRVLWADGSDKWGPIDINQANTPALDLVSGAVGGGGPATIANFDDDPNPEIALAGAYAYVVFEHDGALKWFAPSSDRSSRKTGSSVFDFDGDGIAEAVYADHYWMRVYDGPTGEVRYCECNVSGTLWEYPVIADVDADGHAEIVISSNTLSSSSCPTTLTPEDGRDACVDARIAAGEVNGTRGVRVFASPTRDWVGTRRIWNQHTYHVTNVAEDGTIPAGERPSWGSSYLNSFRQNVQPGASNLADVVPVDVAVDVRGCPRTMTLNVRLRNIGWAAAPMGTPATVYVADAAGQFNAIGRVETTRVLLAGESEILTLSYMLSGDEEFRAVEFRVVVNDPADAPLEVLKECRTDNNEATTSGRCAVN